MRGARLPGWAPVAALSCSLLFAWLNFLFTAKWAGLPGALNGWRWPWYGAALLAATIFTFMAGRSVGQPARPGRPASWVLVAAGALTLVSALFSRLPLSSWSDLLFQDDWTELFQQAVNGVHLLYRGSVVGWNWWLMGGYPTSTDIAQNFSLLGLLPMALAGDRVGYHLLHVVLFLSLPLLVWWDVSREDRDTGLVALGFSAFFVAGFFVTVGNSGDTNSLVGVFAATVALAGSREARRGGRWGGPVLLLGLVFAAYSHQAFFVYACIFLAIESVYYRDRAAFVRLAIAAPAAFLSSLPLHWESFRYHAFVSFNNTVYDPAAPTDWQRFFRLVFYAVEMLVQPHRWFNDYRSLCNVWLPVLAVVALSPGRSRAGFYAWLALTAQLLLRFNTPEAGAMFDRLQHMLPVLAAPALAGFVFTCGANRRLAVSLVAVIGLYVATSYVPVTHVKDLRAWDAPLIDRMSGLDGMIAFEVSPHRDMDRDPVRRTPKTPFAAHFEGGLPGETGRRFYSQMIDGWVWNIWRGQVIGAGTFRGRAIEKTPPEEFAAEMRRWGVRHVFVWTDVSRGYLAGITLFAERWREGRWSDFEVAEADTRSVVTQSGSGRLANLDFLGGDVVLTGVEAGGPVVVRTNYYPAWRAYADGREVALFASEGQLAFRAPSAGSYVVRLEYPRYRGLSLFAACVFLLGALVLSRWPRGATLTRPSPAASSLPAPRA
jgi:hypothetical protein